MSKAIMLEPIGGDTLPYVIPEESSRQYSFEIGSNKNYYRIFAEKRDDATSGRRYALISGKINATSTSNLVFVDESSLITFSNTYYTNTYIDGVLTITNSTTSNVYFKKGVKYYYETW